jgi:AsmA protein
MSGAVRTLAVLLLLPALLLLLLAGTAPLLIDREALARRIEAAVLEAAGQTIHVGGIPTLRLLPHPLVELGPVRLALPADSAPSSTSAQRISLQARALPLLRGRLELASVQLDGLTVLPRHDGGEAARQALNEDNGGIVTPARSAWARLPLQGVGLRAEQVVLRYPTGERGIAWSLLEPDAGVVSPGGTARLDAVIGVDGKAPTLQGELSLSAGVEPQLAPLARPVGRPSQTLSGGGLSGVRIHGLRLQGSGLSIGDGRDVPLLLEADLDYVLEPRRWQMERLAVASGPLRMTLRSVGVAAPDVLSAPIQFRLYGVDLRDWIDSHGYGPVRGLSDTLRCVAAEGMASLAADGLTLSRVALYLDGAEIVGGARLVMVPVPAVDLALAVDRIDLDPYLADVPAAQSAPRSAPAPELAADAPADSTAAPSCDPRPAGLGDWPVPPEQDQNADLQLRFTANWLRIGGLDYQGVFVDARGEQDILAADIDVVDFYAGTLGARLERDLRHAGAPRNTLRGHATSVDAGRLLTDLIGNAPISGTADVTAELAGSGADAPAIRRDLSGALSLAVRDGRLSGLDIDELLAAAGAAPAAGQSAAQFSTLTATASGSGGVFQSNDIAGRSPMLHLNGGGRFDAVAETLDLDLDAELLEPPQGGGLSALAGIHVPMRVTGTWQQPSWQADVGPALREAARRLLDQQLDRHRDTLKALEDRTGIKGLEQGLKGLFGR